MRWFTKNKKYLLVGLAAVFMVPYFASQNMKERKARGLAEASSPLDAKIDGVLVAANKNGVFVVYQDGTRLPADGLGVAGITLEDHKQAPDRLKAAGVKDDDFPVLAFFNATGFDATGDPAVVRRARDGGLVYSGRPEGLVSLAVPQRGGGFVVYKYRDGKLGSNAVKDDDWFRSYMGVEPPRALTPEELDRLTPEQREALGVRRVSKEEFDKPPGGQQDKIGRDNVRKPEGAPNKPDGVFEVRGGLKGKVLKVGDVKNPLIPLRATLYVFEEANAPETGTEAPRYDPDSMSTYVKTQSAEDGGYQVRLPPGTYVLAVEIDGKLYGNALKPGQWPRVKVADKVKEYDFRVPAR